MFSKELIKRISVATICIPILFTVFIIGKIPYMIFINAVIVLGLWEFYILTEKIDIHPSKIIGILSILLISWDIYLNRGQWIWIILLITIFATLTIELFKGKAHPISNAAITLLGVLYISMFSSFILIREVPNVKGVLYSNGGYLVILIFLTIWICDTGAYLLGARWGKHSLFKRVSPNKTWEGAIAGFVTGIGAALGLRFLLLSSLSVFDSLVIGMIVGTIGQLSDLIESMFKRDIGVKDSSNLLPGHGGILDRFDSPLLVGPSVYLYLLLRGLPI